MFGIKDFLVRLGRKRSRAAKVVSTNEITETQHVAGGLSAAKMRELFEVIQIRDIVPRIPKELAGGSVTHILFSGSPLTASFREKGADRIMVGYVGREAIPASNDDRELIFRCASDRLPLKQWSCCWAMASAPPKPAYPIGPLTKELGRIVEPGGALALLDWHPYSHSAIQARFRKPAFDGEEGIGFEKYFKSFAATGLQVTDIRECFVDSRVRKLLESESEQQWYQQHRREPLAITFILKKVK